MTGETLSVAYTLRGVMSNDDDGDVRKSPNLVFRKELGWKTRVQSSWRAAYIGWDSWKWFISKSGWLSTWNWSKKKKLHIIAFSLCWRRQFWSRQMLVVFIFFTWAVSMEKMPCPCCEQVGTYAHPHTHTTPPPISVHFRGRTQVSMSQNLAVNSPVVSFSGLSFLWVFS